MNIYCTDTGISHYSTCLDTLDSGHLKLIEISYFRPSNREPMFSADSRRILLITPKAAVDFLYRVSTSDISSCLLQGITGIKVYGFEIYEIKPNDSTEARVIYPLYLDGPEEEILDVLNGGEEKSAQIHLVCSSY